MTVGTAAMTVVGLPLFSGSMSVAMGSLIYGGVIGAVCGEPAAAQAVAVT